MIEQNPSDPAFYLGRLGVCRNHRRYLWCHLRYSDWNHFCCIRLSILYYKNSRRNILLAHNLVPPIEEEKNVCFNTNLSTQCLNGFHRVSGADQGISVFSIAAVLPFKREPALEKLLGPVEVLGLVACSLVDVSGLLNVVQSPNITVAMMVSLLKEAISFKDE